MPAGCDGSNRRRLRRIYPDRRRRNKIQSMASDFADVTGYPVVCPIYDVEANMGDVMLAGIGTGVLTYEEVKKWQVLDEKIMPDEENHKK